MLFFLLQTSPAPGLPDGGPFFYYVLVGVLSLIVGGIIGPIIKSRNDIDKHTARIKLEQAEKELKKLEEENRKLKEKEEKVWEPMQSKYQGVMLALRFIIPEEEFEKLKQ